MREFETGATRDSEDGKLDYEGFLSPAVLRRFAAYMHQHRVQADGSLRASDNWQKGIPPDAYMKSMWRHFMDVWETHRQSAFLPIEDEDRLADHMEEALCALLFNVMGYLFEMLRDRPDYDVEEWVNQWNKDMGEVAGVSDYERGQVGDPEWLASQQAFDEYHNSYEPF